jgi:hypothetical protein
MDAHIDSRPWFETALKKRLLTMRFPALMQQHFQDDAATLGRSAAVSTNPS